MLPCRGVDTPHLKLESPSLSYSLREGGMVVLLHFDEIAVKSFR